MLTATDREVVSSSPDLAVLLDEAHDCSAAQIDVLGGPAASPARVFVYDPHQAIFGWRHARGVSAIEGLPTHATRPLSRTWRYGAPVFFLLGWLFLRCKRRTL